MQGILHVLMLQDVFSAGCVIAETFLDGKPLFDYAAVRNEVAAWVSCWCCLSLRSCLRQHHEILAEHVL